VTPLARVLAAAAVALPAALALAAGEEPQMSSEARTVPHEPTAFGPDPSYAERSYDTGEQLRIYGGKSRVDTPRPLLELGRPIYEGGPYQAPGGLLGGKNPTDQAFSIYGDLRMAGAYIDDGAVERSIVAARLNVDVDWKLTATERVHAFFRPLDDGQNFSRCERIAGETKCDGEGDLKPETLFFEGDLGAMMAGARGQYSRFDLPFAIGKIPLLFQNGIWLEDAFNGFAFTIPARNSRQLDISNVDLTFFAGFGNVDSGGVRDAANQLANGEADVYGVTAFIEANRGYWELGYAYTDGESDKGFDDQSYHNVALAFTRRYGGWLSNSLRVIHNFGQQRAPGQRQTADGTLLLIESSLITRRPLTLVPYLNLFAGFDRPQSVARDPGAGGILKNVGINFETDGLTGFPKLDDQANNTAGGAIGIQYLFDLQKQLVVEFATVQTLGDAAQRAVPGAQNALGVRYQHNLDKAWLFRADAMYATRNQLEDIGGARVELRRKF
jgi:hypothetical protein